MGAVLFVIAMIITLCCIISTSNFDNSRTFQSKQEAKKIGAYTYTQYKGKTYVNRLMSNGKKVYEFDGKIKEMGTGNIICDLEEMNREAEQAHVIKDCKLCNFDFYPLCLKARDWQKERWGGKRICVEMETGEYFIWDKSGKKYDPNNHNWYRTYLVREKGDHFHLKKEENGHTPLLKFGYEYNYDINEYMNGRRWAAVDYCRKKVL